MGMLRRYRRAVSPRRMICIDLCGAGVSSISLIGIKLAEIFCFRQGSLSIAVCPARPHGATGLPFHLRKRVECHVQSGLQS
ncbi:hypothetical protein AA0311_1794 [Asaia bogorensis NBRC 16594]|uniref:Uncharacterized protein n=1 Tax=Asaia bogorensis NBRC 16594 TaxID=1231624 RepID=A0AAN4R2K8_9PROT|nr:hypothetical protein Asbog_01258 [Asaia bogorensis NBRC 16594]GBQ78480.1 hypothetical protein AA0311_1794 [Asaia bogorensis NBRC 16594]GEL53973.1 hypothetical protein ABO01nite_19800 [Asaia bogorensis NBRC 16594]